MTTTNSERPETGNPIIDELTCWIGAQYRAKIQRVDKLGDIMDLTEGKLKILAKSIKRIEFIEIFENGIPVCLCDYRTINQNI